MATQSCLDLVQQAAGRELSDDELDRLFSELRRRARNKQAKDRLGDDVLMQAAEDMANEEAAAAAIAKRNEALNRAKRLEIIGFVRSQFADDPALGLTASIAGVNRVARGSRWSADAQSKAKAAEYIGGFLADIDRDGLAPYLNRGHLDEKISLELEQIDVPNGRPGISGSKQAQAIAKVVHKYQEAARIDANASGAWIKKHPGYIVRQSHDMARIRSAGFEEWRDFILPRLHERTFDNVGLRAQQANTDATNTFQVAKRIQDDRSEFLRKVYEGLASGVHLKFAGDAKPTGFKGPFNLARSISEDRVLHFKEEAWFEYHQRFGRGNLNEAILFGLERMGRTTGLMQAMGPNPEANFNLIFDELMKGLDADGRIKLKNERGVLEDRLADVTGETNIAGNMLAAQVGTGARIMQDVSKLGMATISAISDIPIAASELRYQGDNMLSGMANQMAGLVDGMANGRQKKEIAAMLGVYFEGQTFKMLTRFDAADAVPGMMTKLHRYFFKLNGLMWWTDNQRATAAQAMSHRLGLNADLPFSELGPDLQRVLGLFAIGEPEWAVLGKAKRKLADGRDYLVPEAVRDLPDDAFAELLGGQKATKARLRNLRSELESKLRSFYVDRSRFAVIEPDARTRAFMRRGTQPGTVFGEFARFIGQFKSFPIAVLQKAVGREVFGRGSNTLGEALKNGNGEMLGLAQMFLWTTLFGYGAMTAKDLFRGKTPRDPLDPRTMVAAALQGGALGIYGDFLFGEMKNRFGGGPITTLLGPTVGTANDILDVLGRIKSGEDPTAQGVRVILNNAPFINLFYTRAALDYLILYQIQEALSPGYLRRLERRVREENEQEFLIPPSTAA